jgi:ABC-type dipeptide/oligopeptide/nickel transport system permease component
LRVRFGLDKPVINCFESLNPIEFGSCNVNPLDTQFFIYVRNLLQGELGISYHTNRPVADVLSERLWNTVLLIGAGQILSIIIGMAFGIFAAWKARTYLDYGAVATSLIAWSLPTFWLGIIAVILGQRQWIPIGRQGNPGHEFHAIVAAMGRYCPPYVPANPDLHDRLHG